MAKSGLIGLNAWVKYTKDVPRKSRKRIENEIKKVSAEMMADAKDIVPVDTGYLRKSINVKMGSDLLSFRLGASAYYAPYVEYGTYFMPARPFISMAIGTHPSKLAEEMRRAVKIEIGKG